MRTITPWCRGYHGCGMCDGPCEGGLPHVFSEDSMKLRFKAGFDRFCAWGLPESQPRELCAICAGPLLDIPLIIWDARGASARLCKSCMEEWVEPDDKP
jgi:hypothetical protein